MKVTELSQTKIKTLLAIHHDVQRWLEDQITLLLLCGATEDEIHIHQQGPTTYLCHKGLTKATCTISFTNGIRP